MDLNLLSQKWGFIFGGHLFRRPGAKVSMGWVPQCGVDTYLWGDSEEVSLFSKNVLGWIFRDALGRRSYEALIEGRRWILWKCLSSASQAI